MNNSEKWSDEKFRDWKKFWESEMGEIALAKMKELKDRWIEASMQAQGADQTTYCVGRAAGIDIILNDIQSGINVAEELDKK